MTMNLRTLVVSSGLFGLLLAAVGGAIGGLELAVGIVVTTALMLLNLWGWSVVVGRAIGAAVQGQRSTLALGLYGVKGGGLFVSLWVLLKIFPVMSVILGSSVVFGALSVWATRQVLMATSVGDA